MEGLESEISKISKRIEAKNEALHEVNLGVEKIAGPEYRKLREAVESLEFEIKDLFDDL